MDLSIIRSRRQEIKELRDLNSPDGIYRELFRVTVPDPRWNRYLVLAEGIDMLEGLSPRDKSPRQQPGEG